MKKLAALLAVACVTGAPTAHAQMACEEIGRLNAAGLGGFESIQGPAATDDPEDDIYESRATLLGAKGCLIDQYFEPVHMCSWEYGTEAEVMAAYATMNTAVTPCMAGWKREGLLVNGPDEKGYRILAGAGLLGPDIYEDLVWSIFADFDPERSAKPYLLVAELVDYH